MAKYKGLALNAQELAKLTNWPPEIIEDYLYLATDKKLEDIPTDLSSGSVMFVDGGFLGQSESLLWDNNNKILFVSSVALNNEGLKIKDLSGGDYLTIKPNSNLTADRTLSLVTGDTNREIILLGNPTLDDWFDQGVKTTSDVVFNGVEVDNLTPVRLVFADAGKNLVSVDDLTDWIAGTANQVLITDDTDGTITISFANPTRLGSPANIALGNYAEFGADGSLTLNGDARVLKEFQLNANSFSPGASGATQTLVGHLSGWSFGTGDEIVANFEVPHDWDPTTDINIVIYWAINEAYATNTGEVQWQVTWAAVPPDETEAIDSPTDTGTIDYGDQNIPATAYHLTEGPDGPIAAASLSPGDLIGLVISRVALDDGSDPTAEPIIFHVEIHYTSNVLGE